MDTGRKRDYRERNGLVDREMERRRDRQRQAEREINKQKEWGTDSKKESLYLCPSLIVVQLGME